MNLKPLDKLICRVGITKESTPLQSEKQSEKQSESGELQLVFFALISFFCFAA